MAIFGTDFEPISEKSSYLPAICKFNDLIKDIFISSDTRGTKNSV